MSDIPEVNLAFFKPLCLKKVAHYCFVVKDIKTAANTNYKVKKWYLPILKIKQYYKENTAVNYSVDLAFGFKNGKQIELLASNEQENSIFGNFLKEKEGFHHVGFEVKNLEESIKKFKEKGFSPVLTGLFKTKGGLVSKIAFFDTRKEIGVYTELVEMKLLKFPIKQNEFLLKLGVVLGDVKKMVI